MRYKLIVFDIDGTLTDNPNPWLTIHHYLSTWKDLTEKYKEVFLKGEITYEEFCKLEVMHWKGADVAEIEKLFLNLKTPANLFFVLKEFKKIGLRLVAISSGVQFIAEALKLKQIFDDIFFNEIEVKGGVLTGEVKVNVSNKVVVLDEYLKKEGVNYKEVIVIGDGNNDVGILKKAGLGIAFCPKSKSVRRAAEFEVTDFDYREILAYIKKHLNFSLQATKI
ncbi:MAG: HAD-IB family phosphatase [bacterium]|nr:HAD-IB family phosphatase [bacterium]